MSTKVLCNLYFGNWIFKQFQSKMIFLLIKDNCCNMLETELTFHTFFTDTLYNGLYLVFMYIIQNPLFIKFGRHSNMLLWNDWKIKCNCLFHQIFVCTFATVFTKLTATTKWVIISQKMHKNSHHKYCACFKKQNHTKLQCFSPNMCYTPLMYVYAHLWCVWTLYFVVWLCTANSQNLFIICYFSVQIVRCIFSCA